MADIDRVREPELRRRLEEDVADALYDRRLLALPHVNHLEKAAVAFAQIQDVAEHFVDELIELAESDDRRVLFAQRSDEELDANMS